MAGQVSVSARTLAESGLLGNRRMRDPDGRIDKKITPSYLSPRAWVIIALLMPLHCRPAEARIAPHFPLVGRYAEREEQPA
jgi:hypothetical protein